MQQNVFTDGFLLLFFLPFGFMMLKAIIDSVRVKFFNRNHNHTGASIFFLAVYCVVNWLYVSIGFQQFLGFLLMYGAVFFTFFDASYNLMTFDKVELRSKFDWKIWKLINYFNPKGSSWIDRNFGWSKANPMIRLLIGGVMGFFAINFYQNDVEKLIGYDIDKFGIELFIGFAVLFVIFLLGQTGILKRIFQSK